MIKIAERPYQLLFFTALLLILLSAFVGKGSLDVKLGEGMYYIDGVFVLRAVGMFLLLNWLLYRFTQRLMFSKVLIWLHVIISIAVVAFLTIVLFKSGVQHPQRYFDYTYTTVTDMNLLRRIRFIVPLCVILIIIAQALFFINLLLGILRRVN